MKHERITWRDSEGYESGYQFGFQAHLERRIWAGWTNGYIIILLNAGWFRFYTNAWLFTVNVAFFELAPHRAKTLDRIVEPSILSSQSETGTVLQMFPALFLLVPRSLSLSRFAYVIYHFLVVAIAMATFQEWGAKGAIVPAISCDHWLYIRTNSTPSIRSGDQ